ncbi:MAG: hypothetical protein NZ953_04375, partial [Thaumarchaeota archaeon]|nr:hypothetical protein [Candidatus Calditenuaceae archaeon]
MEELEELMKRWEGIIKNELKKKFGGEWYVSIIHDVEVRPDVDGIEVFTIFASPNDHSGRVYELFYPVKIYEIYEPDDKDR